jgi:tetratricopeptide (TPR) repeat protein
MKKNNYVSYLSFVLILFIFTYISSAQNSTAKTNIAKNNGKTATISLNDMDKLIEEKMHEQYSSYEKNLQYMQNWLGFLLVVITIIISTTSLQILRHSSREIKQLEKERKTSKEELENLRNKIQDIKNQASDTITNKIYSEFYSLATNLIEEENLKPQTSEELIYTTESQIRIALSYLTFLYKNEFNPLEVVCRHISVCYKKLKNYEEALKYAQNALEIADDEGKSSMLHVFEKEISKIEELIKARNKMPENQPAQDESV